MSKTAYRIEISEQRKLGDWTFDHNKEIRDQVSDVDVMLSRETVWNEERAEWKYREAVGRFARPGRVVEYEDTKRYIKGYYQPFTWNIVKATYIRVKKKPSRWIVVSLWKYFRKLPP